MSDMDIVESATTIPSHTVAFLSLYSSSMSPECPPELLAL